MHFICIFAICSSAVELSSNWASSILPPFILNADLANSLQYTMLTVAFPNYMLQKKCYATYDIHIFLSFDDNSRNIIWKS